MLSLHTPDTPLTSDDAVTLDSVQDFVSGLSADQALSLQQLLALQNQIGDANDLLGYRYEAALVNFMATLPNLHIRSFFTRALLLNLLSA